MALNRSDKSRILRRYFPGMTRNSEMSTEPNTLLDYLFPRLNGNVPLLNGALGYVGEDPHHPLATFGRRIGWQSNVLLITGTFTPVFK